MFKRPTRDARHSLSKTFGEVSRPPIEVTSVPRSEYMNSSLAYALDPSEQEQKIRRSMASRHSGPVNDQEGQGGNCDEGESLRTPQGGGRASNGPRILSIGGGKGGIGKSFLSANMAVSLTRQGYRVALVDLDSGAANLHTCLGVPSPKVGLFDFVSGRIDNLEDVAV